MLIVGTGPSLDLLNQSIIDKYDAIYLINHAIENPLFAPDKIRVGSVLWYSGDTSRFISLLPVLFCRCDIHKVFAPFLDNGINLSFFYRQRSDFTLLRVDSHSLIGGFYTLIMVLTTGAFPPFTSANLLSNSKFYLENHNQPLPITGFSSALSLLLLLAKIGYTKIDLIGCDFSSGRSVLHSRQGSASFDQTDTLSRFKLLASLLDTKGVIVNNLSWS